MSIEACGGEDGQFLLLRGGAEIVRLPVVTAHRGVTVCEFRRVDRDLSSTAVVELVRAHLLERFLDGVYREPTIELVDLDEQRWTRAPFDAPADQLAWTPLAAALPPDLATRPTALARPEPAETLPLRLAVEGFRSAWTAACASPDGRAIATAHGTTGTVWITHLDDGRVERLPPCGAPIFSLAWGSALVALEVKVAHLHVWDEARWTRLDLGTGPKLRACWSPDARELAVACLDGQLRIFDWDTKRARLSFAPGGGESLYDVRYGHDGERLFIGHKLPRISVHRAHDGELLHEVRGTQHFQAGFRVAPDGALLCSTLMKKISIFDGRGELEGEIPSAASFGVTSGGFARGGALIVTECKEGSVKVFARSDRSLLGSHTVPKEPLVVLDDAIVARNASEKRLEVRALPALTPRAA